MSVPVNTLDELRQHLAPVLAGRAGPDAGEAGPTVLALIGALLWRKDQARSRSGPRPGVG